MEPPIPPLLFGLLPLLGMLILFETGPVRVGAYQFPAGWVIGCQAANTVVGSTFSGSRSSR